MRSLIAMAAGIFLLNGLVRGDDWEYYQGDLQHTGSSDATFDPSKLTLSWSAPVGYATPVIVGSQIIATHNGQGTDTPTTISSFAVSNGALNWSYTGNFIFPSEAAYGNGLVVFTAEDQTTHANNLFVLDANTGALKYTVPISDAFSSLPVIATNPNTGNLVAYFATGGTLTAVKLGSSSGSILWTANGSFGGQSIPSLVGNSLILAGPGQYYSIDATTGAVNHFQAGNISGGGGTTVAVDATRKEFYVLEDYSVTTFALTAYQYTNNSTITQLWQKTGNGISSGGSVAIGANGDVYAAGGNTLLEIDPATGATLRSLGSQNFSNGIAPVVDGNDLFAYSDYQTLIYSLSSFSLVQTLPGSRGSLNTAFDGPGALDDSHFVIDYGDIYDSPGFDVYSTSSVPEPSNFLLFGIGATAVVGYGFRPRRGARRPLL